MSEAIASGIITNVFSGLDDGDQVTFVFQGGEPTIAGLEFFKNWIDTVDSVNHGVCVSYCLQTNGILLDKDWCAFLRDNNFLVGLSFDGLANVHDALRIDGKKKGTFIRVSQARRLLEKNGVEYNILTVLTNELAKYPVQVWNYLCKEDIKYVQYVPCLGDLSGKETEYQLKPKRYADFYNKLFELWSKDFDNGKYRSVKLFDDLIHLLANGSQNACGMLGFCMPQLVLESDGSAYPCDFYALDEYRLGNLAEESFDFVYKRALESSFRGDYQDKLMLCNNCNYKAICNGGCKRMRKEVCGPKDASGCGQKIFLDQNISKLQQYAYWEGRALGKV